MNLIYGMLLDVCDKSKYPYVYIFWNDFSER